MYSIILLVHSWLRWLVVVVGVLALLAPPRRADRDRTGLLFTITMDVQFLLGLLLYVALSPLTRAAFHRMDVAMHNDQLRFWVAEHPFGMVLALMLAHLGRAKPRWRTVFFVVALVLLLATLPWPGLPYGRPLFRLR